MNETIEFAMYVSGKDRETVERMYLDWYKGQLYLIQSDVCQCAIPECGTTMRFCYKCGKPFKNNLLK